MKHEAQSRAEQSRAEPVVMVLYYTVLNSVKVKSYFLHTLYSVLCPPSSSHIYYILQVQESDNINLISLSLSIFDVQSLSTILK